MAIDTASKRASVMGINNVSNLFIFPDGTIDQGDRQTFSDLYSGILAGISQKWVVQPPDNTVYSTQPVDSTSYIKQTEDATVWIKQEEDS